MEWWGKRKDKGFERVSNALQTAGYSSSQVLLRVDYINFWKSEDEADDQILRDRLREILSASCWRWDHHLDLDEEFPVFVEE